MVIVRETKPIASVLVRNHTSTALYSIIADEKWHGRGGNRSSLNGHVDTYPNSWHMYHFLFRSHQFVLLLSTVRGTVYSK